MMINTAVNTGIGSIKGAIKSTDGSAEQMARRIVHPLAPASAVAPVNAQWMQTAPSAAREASSTESLPAEEAAIYQAQGGVSIGNEVGQLIDTFA
jgi:hypothetical protein